MKAGRSLIFSSYPPVFMVQFDHDPRWNIRRLAERAAEADDVPGLSDHGGTVSSWAAAT
ncbi:hypothetical protein [Sorangium sp. So ce854]|uniref:hypothetical protein n=1 Tax=Sorangium sp. So ce854 TaxID=3133322 RepID=UPI003F5DBC32